MKSKTKNIDVPRTILALWRLAKRYRKIDAYAQELKAENREFGATRKGAAIYARRHKICKEIIELTGKLGVPQPTIYRMGKQLTDGRRKSLAEIVLRILTGASV